MVTSRNKLARMHWRKPEETESLFVVVHSNPIRINYIKVNIENTQQNSKCKLN